MDEWDHIEWNKSRHRRQPAKEFFMFSINPVLLQKISCIYRRDPTTRNSSVLDLGIQRVHEQARSKEIGQYVKYGYPWSAIGNRAQQSDKYLDLKNPGWLPTAIVINILTADDTRDGRKVHSDELIEFVDGSPPKFLVPQTEEQISVPPVEIIDGQHRLLSFGEEYQHREYELPVVAFFGLDVSWQAYLFYTINIKPKRINASLAFDLYPLLRTQDWLTKPEGLSVYRETRCQAIVDMLHSHPRSPWFHRIDMIGARQSGSKVTQNSWIRSLMATLVKHPSTRRGKIGGLFSSNVGALNSVLPWTSAQQIAFLIVFGTRFEESITSGTEPWMKEMRSAGIDDDSFDEDKDPAYVARRVLFNTDQGMRVLLHTMNDVCFVWSDELQLSKWINEWNKGHAEIVPHEEINFQVSSLMKRLRITTYMDSVCKCLATFDWRTFSAPGVDEASKSRKAAYRGSGGYGELRGDLLEHLANSNGEYSEAVTRIQSILE